MTRPQVYFEPRDVWVGYYRGDTHHYVCPIPCVVIRWRRGKELDPMCTVCGAIYSPAGCQRDPLHPGYSLCRTGLPGGRPLEFICSLCGWKVSTASEGGQTGVAMLAGHVKAFHPESYDAWESVEGILMRARSSDSGTSAPVSE